MPTLLVRHQVRDYNLWKPVYDNVNDVRKRYGIGAASVHRDPKDQYMLVVTHLPPLPQATA